MLTTTQGIRPSRLCRCLIRSIPYRVLSSPGEGIHAASIDQVSSLKKKDKDFNIYTVLDKYLPKNNITISIMIDCSRLAFFKKY